MSFQNSSSTTTSKVNKPSLKDPCVVTTICSIRRDRRTDWHSEVRITSTGGCSNSKDVGRFKELSQFKKCSRDLSVDSHWINRMGHCVPLQSHRDSTIINIIAEVVLLSNKLTLKYKFKKNFLNSINLNASTMFIISLSILYKLKNIMKMTIRSVNVSIKQTHK